MFSFQIKKVVFTDTDSKICYLSIMMAPKCAASSKFSKIKQRTEKDAYLFNIQEQLIAENRN